MKIVFCGGTGSFGTSLGNILSIDNTNQVFLLGRDKKIVDSINDFKINSKRFPNIYLNKYITATMDNNELTGADIIFLSLPSGVVIDYMYENRDLIDKDTILVNLAKGFSKKGDTITKSLEKIINNPLVSLKGPTFASELIHNYPSAFTLGCKDQKTCNIFKKLFNNTNVFLDYSDDVEGVELLSILKNIYAICLGIVDAYFNSANTRFLILTKAFTEMKKILEYGGGKEETLYKYCGFGDFGLTALNDLSRNRTLGLMIGKGFLSSNMDNSVILEGKRSLKILYEKLPNDMLNEYPIISALYALLCGTKNIGNIPEFIKKVIGEDI